MTLARAIKESAAAPIDLRLTTRLPKNSSGTWCGFLRNEGMVAATAYNVIGAFNGGTTVGWCLQRQTTGSLSLITPPGGVLITGPAYASSQQGSPIFIALVFNGRAATFYWKIATIVHAGNGAGQGDAAWGLGFSGTSPRGGSATNALHLAAEFAPTTIGIFSPISGVNGCIGATWGWRYWPAGNNPTAAEQLEIESRSLYPVYPGASIIWALQGDGHGALFDQSGYGRHLVHNTTNAFKTTGGAVLGFVGSVPVDQRLTPTSEALWSASQRSLRNPLLGL